MTTRCFISFGGLVKVEGTPRWAGNPAQLEGLLPDKGTGTLIGRWSLPNNSKEKVPVLAITEAQPALAFNTYHSGHVVVI